MTGTHIDSAYAFALEYANSTNYLNNTLNSNVIGICLRMFRPIALPSA